MKNPGRSSFFVALSLVLVLSGSLLADNPQDFRPLLEGIKDSGIRTTLERSISAGLISDCKDFENALDLAWSRRNSGKVNGGQGELARKIQKLCEGLAEKDADAIRGVTIDGRDRLFTRLDCRIPPSYLATVELAKNFNPKVGTAELPRFEKQIDEYFRSIANDPVIRHALSITGTTIDDMKMNWFGSGAGFEHVLCGEMKSSSVSGYHWWFKFYSDEQDGRARYERSVDHKGDTHIFTGRFTWDPDGSGPLPKLSKSKGGFTIGNSAQVILAMGHIAIETARSGHQAPSGIQFKADINGQTYVWQLYTMNGTIRSLYPICGSGDSQGDRDPSPAGPAGECFGDPSFSIQEYYDLEAETLGELPHEDTSSLN